MTEAGLVKVSEAKANGRWQKASERDDGSKVPTVLEQALARNGPARDNFGKLAPSYRRQFILWIVAAKREETRARRVTESVRLLAANKRLGMK